MNEADFIMLLEEMLLMKTGAIPITGGKNEGNSCSGKYRY